MCTCSRASRTPSPGAGPWMGLTPPVPPTGYNSKAPSPCSIQNSFGKLKWRANVSSSPGFWCKIKFLRHAIYKREGGHTKATARCATVPWKLAFTFVYCALLLKQFRIRSSIGKTSPNCNNSSRSTPYISEHGGKRRQGKCPNQSLDG
jgi:hypothetical protein